MTVLFSSLNNEVDFNGKPITKFTKQLWVEFANNGPEHMLRCWENNPDYFNQQLKELENPEVAWYMIKVMENLGCVADDLTKIAMETPHAKPDGVRDPSTAALVGLGYTLINPGVNNVVFNALAVNAAKNFRPSTYRYADGADDVVMSTESSRGVAAAAPSFSTSSPFMASSSSTVGSSTYRSTPTKKKTTPTKNERKVPIKANRSSGKASRKVIHNRSPNRRGGGGNTTPRKTVSNGMSNRPPMPPVNLTGVFGSQSSTSTPFSFGAPPSKPAEEPDIEDERRLELPPAASSRFGAPPSPIASQWTYSSTEPSLVAEENTLRTNPFEQIHLSQLTTNFTNLKVVERPLNGDEISQSNPLSMTCSNMIEDPKEVEAYFDDADTQLGRWVKNMAKESTSMPAVKFMSAVKEEENKRGELVSKEEEIKRAAQSRLNFIPSQLSTAVGNSKLILDNEISSLRADREAELKRINAEYDGYEDGAKQDHDDFVTAVSTSASESEDKCKGVIASANDNIIQLNEDEKKDLTKVKAQVKVLKHSFRMFELYGQGVTARQDSQGNFSTYNEADLMKEKLLTVMHPALASGDDDRMIREILSVD